MYPDTSLIVNVLSNVTEVTNIISNDTTVHQFRTLAVYSPYTEISKLDTIVYAKIMVGIKTWAPDGDFFTS